MPTDIASMDLQELEAALKTLPPMKG